MSNKNKNQATAAVETPSLTGGMVSMADFIGSKPKTEISFTVIDIIESESENGGTVSVLKLDEVMAHIPGSQTVKDETTNEEFRIDAYDVEEVKVHSDIFTNDAYKADFKIDPVTKRGTYSGKLKLDVTQDQEVWLRDKSLSSFGREKRKEYKTKKQGGLLAKIRARQAGNAQAGATPRVTTNEG